MNQEQFKEFLVLEEEFGTPTGDSEIAVARGLRQGLDDVGMRRVKYEALKRAYQESQRVLKQYATNGEKEHHISAMRAFLEIAYWPEQYVAQHLDKPERKPYKSHFRG